MRRADWHEGVILEVEAFHARVGWHRVDFLLAPRAEQHDGGRHVQLGIVKARDGRGRHEVAPAHHHRVIVGGTRLTLARDVLIELHLCQAVIGQRMQAARLGQARLQPEERLGHRHLEDHHLALLQRAFGDAVARLDDGGIGRPRRGLHGRHAGEEAADGDGVGRVIRTLVDHLQNVARAEDGGRHLDAAGAPAIGQWHFARTERDLMAGDGQRLEDRAADHPFRRLIQIGEVVSGLLPGQFTLHGFAFRRSDGIGRVARRDGVHSAAFGTASASQRARMLRSFSSSLWKST